MLVRQIRPGEERDAVCCLLEVPLGRAAQAAEVDAFLLRARQTGTDLSHQVVAVTSSGEFVGVALCDISPDGSATASPPVCRKSFDAPALKRDLLFALRRMCVDEGLDTLQVFCDADDVELHETLSDCGFERLASMLFMQRAVEKEDRDIVPAAEISWETFSPRNEDNFVRTVARTYEKTLDCPKLQEGRRVRGKLLAYRRCAAFSPELWMLAKLENAPCACLLLMPHPEDESCELSYVGVVPEFRGRGLGRKAVERAMRLLAERQLVKRFWLAVDGANVPAVKIYERLGFSAYDRREVYFSLLAHEQHGVGDMSEKS